MKGRLVACASLVALLPATSAAVPTIYTYTGDNYTNIGNVTPPAGTYTTGMNLFGSITLADALPANATTAFSSVFADIASFSFFDGRITYDQANISAGSASFSLTTNSSGGISAWTITMSRPSPLPDAAGANFLTQSACITVCDFAQINPVVPSAVDIGQATSTGSWAVTAVPEPSTYALFLAGIALVGFAAKRHMRLP